MNRIERVKKMKENYPEGTKVKLLYMEDRYPPPPGTMGTVEYIDDIGNIHVRWETGSSLSLIPDVDKFEVVSADSVSPERPDVDVVMAVDCTYITTIYGEAVDTDNIEEIIKAAECMLGDADHGEFEICTSRPVYIKNVDTGEVIWENREGGSK